MERTFIEAIKHRRSYYAIGKQVNIPDPQIRNIIELALRYIPSAFNSKSTRIVLLLGKSHDELWGIVKDTLKEIVPEQDFPKTEQKINTSFAAGYGTVLYYEDMEVVESLQRQFPLYAEKFPVWAEHTSAMHQFAIWTMLEDSGLAASLQHYNPLIDSKIAEKWDVPHNWKLIAQMPFGNPLGQPSDKPDYNVDSSLKVF